MKNALSLAAALLLSAAWSSAADAGAKVSFKKDVEPILKASCVKCHGLDPKFPKRHAAAKLRLDNEKDAMKGGKNGPAIVPGKAEDSLLYKLLKGPVKEPDADSDRDIDPMPKAKKGEKWKPLPDDQIDTIKRWIDQGASWNS